MRPASAKGYRAAYMSFRDSYNSCSYPDEIISSRTLEDWIKDMASCAIKLTTARFYIENLRSLCNKAVGAGIAVDTSAFDALVHAGDMPASEAVYDARTVLPTINRIAMKGMSANGQIRLTADILMFILYTGGMPLSEVIKLKKGCLPESLPSQARDIARRNISPVRRYVFPLQQGRSTDRQIAITLAKRMTAILADCGLPRISYDDLTAGILWMDAALQAGFDAGIVRGCMPAIPKINHAAMLVKPATLSMAEIWRYRGLVADSMHQNKLRWHAMRLRRGVTPDDISARVRETGDKRVEMPLIYYPTEELFVKAGRKMERRTRALIRDIMFFKSVDSAIRPLFRVIGDLAWCYRQTASPDSPYAVIPQASMLGFQRMVEQFTPDMNIGLFQDDRLAKGRMVRITSGTMAGYTGMIYDMRKDDGSPVPTRVFRLKITGDFGIQWSVDIPEIYLEELPQ